jgi:tyrosine-protein kinase
MTDSKSRYADPGGDQSGRGVLIRALLRRWWLVVLCVVVGAGSAGFISARQQKQYQATAKLLFRDDISPDQSLQTALGFSPSATVADPTQQAATNVALISADTVSTMTAEALGGHPSAGTIQSEIGVSEVGQSSVVSITATDPFPARAATLANTFAHEVIIFRQNADRSLINSGIEGLQHDLNALSPQARSGPSGQNLTHRIEQLTSLVGLQTGGVEIAQTASAPSTPALPRTKMNIAAGGVLGLILGIALAIVFYRLDRRPKTPEEIADAYRLPLLGVVPRTPALRSGDSDLMAEEAFRAVRARLQYFNVDRGISSVLVTSATQGEGKSTVAWQLARVIAMTRKSTVLLLETDLRRPVFADKHGLDPSPGLSELLTHDIGLDDVIQKVSAGAPDLRGGPAAETRNGSALAAPVRGARNRAVANGNGAGHPDNGAEHLAQPAKRGAHSAPDELGPTIDVITAGSLPPNPADLVESDAMSDLLRKLSDRYDFIMLDSPPGPVVSDTLPLMSHVDGVIVVSSLRHVTRRGAERLLEELESVHARPLGVVVNQAKPLREGYYGYGYRSPQAARTASVAAPPGADESTGTVASVDEADRDADEPQPTRA